jgi:ATP phosphoribosyltransferase
VTREFFARQGQQVDIIKLYGAMELAPIMGLADRIVDIVDTGNTLRANGLEAMEHIADISSRLVVGQPSMKMKYDQIQPILDRLTQAVIAKRSAS